MKKLAAILAFSFAFSFAGLSARAQSKSFEGTMTWNMTMAQLGGDTIPMTMNFKDGKIEQEMNLGQPGLVKSYIVTENNQRKIYSVMEAMKMGMVMDIPTDTSSPSTPNTSLVKTGKSATIAGHHADEYLIKDSKVDMSVWATPDVPKELRESMAKAMQDQPHQSEATSSAYRELASKGLMPVKIVASKDGETAMSMVLVSFQKKSLPDALFVPPTDIKYRPMPAGMGGGQ